MNHCVSDSRRRGVSRVLIVLVLLGGTGLAIIAGAKMSSLRVDPEPGVAKPDKSAPPYAPRRRIDVAGFAMIANEMKPTDPDATLAEIADVWDKIELKMLREVEAMLSNPQLHPQQRFMTLLEKVQLLNYHGDAKASLAVIEEMLGMLKSDPEIEHSLRYTFVFLKGVVALRLGENENCILCRGESSCILPISRAAQHVNPAGSRMAVEQFTDYLQQFPDDLEVKWLLNVAHMTLGEYPEKVDPRFLVSIERFSSSEHSIGKFRDIGHLVGVNRLNQAGGAIMEDFDNDGLLDIVTTSMEPTVPMQFYRNTGKGTFEERSKEAGLAGQTGGLFCVQTDYNNDGRMDILVIRGAWIPSAMRPSLLRNNEDGTFTDVTEEAGLLHGINAITASTVDYDHDGWLDLFIPCERSHNRLYRNLGNGKFEDVSIKAGVTGRGDNGKGSAWVDIDNDGFQDLFVNYLTPDPATELYRNNRDGTFTPVTSPMGIKGPVQGFSCWAWDFNNDGWQDIFASCYDRTTPDIIKGLEQPNVGRPISRLYMNLEGKGFRDVASQIGLDRVYCAMGSNFADFDNDGFEDFYLGTGEPSIATLIPNRMLRNLGGKQFVEITASSGTGSLQKGHGVACGDWDRDGTNDLFIEMGGAINGDEYHNILFQNPGGHGNHWLTLKLHGKKTNRPAIGARIKIVTAGEHGQTIHRHISSGSSFGANPMQQTIGLGKSDRIELLEITWPTSKTSQQFRDVSADQAISITEFAENYEPLNWTPVTVPKS
jgi:hypothetical protein